MILNIYTDGSIYQGEGGWAAVFVASKGNKEVIRFIGGHESKTTIGRMEIMPMIQTLEVLEKSTLNFQRVDVYSDSQYVVNTINGWLEKWISTNRHRNKKNMDLWMRFRESHGNAKFQMCYQWVRGHNGNRFNELADKLAGEARVKKLNTERLTAC